MSTTAMASTITILISHLFAVWLAVSNCIYDNSSNAYSNLLHYSHNHVNIFPSPRIAGLFFLLRITVNRRLCALCKVVFMHTPLVLLLVNTCSFSILWSQTPLSSSLSLSLCGDKRISVWEWGLVALAHCDSTAILKINSVLTRTACWDRVNWKWLAPGINVTEFHLLRHFRPFAFH